MKENLIVAMGKGRGWLPPLSALRALSLIGNRRLGPPNMIGWIRLYISIADAAAVFSVRGSKYSSFGYA